MKAKYDYNFFLHCSFFTHFYLLKLTKTFQSLSLITADAVGLQLPAHMLRFDQFLHQHLLLPPPLLPLSDSGKNFGFYISSGSGVRLLHIQSGCVKPSWGASSMR